jgi:hypothetical protein
MSTVVDFTSQVFAFIENTYGKGVIKKVKLKKNNDVVDRILLDSQTKSYSTEKTGNKLIAMLRLNS